MTFTDKLKELVGKSKNRPWRMSDPYAGECFIYRSDDHTLTCGYDGEIADIDAALIVHLVNHAEDIVALVEVMEGIKNIADRSIESEVYTAKDALLDVQKIRMISMLAIKNLEAKP